ncbi:MAG: glycosyltransferase family 9 protein [Steroidobacteraceae bacterium]
MAGGSTFIRYKLTRLYHKYRDVRDSSGSRLQATAFVLLLIARRLDYLYEHLLARRARRNARMATKAPTDSATPHLAVKITGGLGDYVVAARYLRDLADQVEPFSFDLYSGNPDIAAWIFESVPGFGNSYTEFLFDELKAKHDLALWVMHFVVAYAEFAAWRKLRRNQKLCDAVENISKFGAQFEPFIQHHPRWDNFLARQAVYMNRQRRNLLHAFSGIKPGDDSLLLETDESIIATLGLTRGSFVTIHNGFDLSVVVIGSAATKCYPHFAEVVRLLKAERPDLPIVQIGARTSTPIPGVDHNLISKINLRQPGALLRHAVRHIDNEGGLVHLARCFGTRSTVIFGPTPIDYFGYKENQNIPPSACGGCWFITESWMSHCPRGFATPICTEQEPATIARMILAGIPQMPRLAGPVSSTQASAQ